ncbi:delta endotoxin, N-terminal domain [Tenacibaculum sp. MAR_2010_89]|uniref:insecticidal delta-endotoxin Cry8Ea1 family protein n=1 Tax=Tenacibaculum sp. MAR_2010_89 TaxID=1250198 RepID=UPI0008986380|nr:insecticidal delta-endotoxin Cry8Ea1 family protein [Tenacibaculum sp. MAR_2010_89]SEE67477.1 delta endotoxin, N-terminal domain [Tenacibaculum sp. MAR_2010_89]
MKNTIKKRDLSENWNDRLKKVAQYAVKKIPEVGGFISYLVGQFWPSDNEDIFELMIAEVEGAIDKKILKYEMEQTSNNLASIRDLMNDYVHTENNKEKGISLKVILGQCTQLMNNIIGSSNSKFLIPYASICANMHMTALREQLIYGEELYEIDGKKEWEREIKKYYDDYHCYFEKNYPELKKWRFGQIKIDYGSKHNGIYPISYGSAKDLVTEKEIYYDKNWAQGNLYEGVMEAIRERWENEALSSIAKCLISTYTLHRYVSGNPDEPANVYDGLDVLYLGPYSAATDGTKSDGQYQIKKTDKEGIIKEFYYRSYNTIDGLQFIYDDHKGHFTGNPDGGIPYHIFVGSERYATGVISYFNAEPYRGLMQKIGFVFSDGTIEGDISSIGDNSYGTIDDNYELICGGFTLGVGPSNTKGIDVIKLTFKYHE